MVGHECLEDPCDGITCHYVDDVDGDDTAEGTVDAPWRTLGRLGSALAAASPGDHFLLRRGGTWGDPSGGFRLEVDGVAGSPDAPVVLGAYGPLADGRPRIDPGNLRIRGSSQLVVRDLDVRDDPADPDLTAMFGSRPCILIENSDHVTIYDNVLSDCVARGIWAFSASAYVAVVANAVHDVSNDGISITDATWEDPIVRVGAHHWVLDNVVENVNSTCISIGVGAPELVVGDTKVVGNIATDCGVEGISSSTVGFTWVLDNVVARATGTASWQAGIRISAGGDGQVSGNVVFETGVGGIVVDRTATAVANTVIHDGTVGDVLGLDDGAQITASHNLLWARGGQDVVRVWSGTAADHVLAMDQQWYASTDASDCTFGDANGSTDLPGWRAATGLDLASSCGPVPGIGGFVPGVPAAAWDDEFWSAFVPDASWSGCADPAGARDCDGAPIGPPAQPLSGYDESGGLGWAGPLVVRQRYDVAP